VYLHYSRRSGQFTKYIQLAKVHVKLCDNMKVIYVQNFQDICNEIGTSGRTLMRGFLGLSVTVQGRGNFSLIHSIHNTDREHVKAVLAHQENYDYAIEQLAVIHQALLSGVPQEYHEKVSFENQEAGLSGSHCDTIQSCNSSQHANELLNLYNPQDAEVPPKEIQKWFKPSVISYAAVVAATLDTSATEHLDSGIVTTATPSRYYVANNGAAGHEYVVSF